MDQVNLTDLEATKQLFDRLKIPYAESTEDLGSEENPWFQIIGVSGTEASSVVVTMATSRNSSTSR